jgi:hypothetical protein
VRAVLDASAAIEIVVERTQAARLAAILEEAGVVLAPGLFVSEVVNTIWKYYRFEQWNLAVCDRAIESALGMVDALVPSIELYGEASCWRGPHGVPPTACSISRWRAARTPLCSPPTLSLRKEAERQGIRVA